MILRIHNLSLLKTNFLLFVLSLLITHSFYSTVSGQNSDIRLSGIVLSKDGQALSNVICKLLDTNNKLVSYSFSDEKGYFSLKGDKINASSLSFEMLGYKQQYIEIKQIKDINDIKINLVEDLFTLPEVTVKVQPIQRRSDTIVYNAISFTGQEDRYLDDLLRKLPGIKVNDNGTVSYQGEAINKFYIEGHDLLGGQYTLATKNLPIDAVSQIEIMENHQHRKVLKGVDFSDKSALNVKLKKSHLLKPFGEIQTDIGEQPFLYNAKAFLTQVSTNMQTMLTFKANNTGTDITDEADNKINVNNYSSFYLSSGNLLLYDNFRNLPIRLNRYLFNRSYLGSINNLISLSKETELKMSLSFFNNREEQDYILNQTFATGTGELNINETSNRINKTNALNGTVVVEHNSYNAYIKNEINASIRRNRNNELINTDIRRIKSVNSNKPASFQNDFQAIIKYKQSRTIKINSFIRYLNKTEALNLNGTDLQNDSPVTESFGEHFYLARNRISTSFLLFGHNLDVGVGVNFNSTDIDLNLPDSVNHNKTFHKSKEIQSILSFDYQLKLLERMVTTVNIPVNYYQYDIQNLPSQSIKDNHFVITPSISNYYEINYLWKANARLGYDWNYDDFLFNTATPFLRNYRMTYIPSDIIPYRENFFVGAGIKFSDLSKMLFFDFSAMYRAIQSNNISKINHTTDMSFYTTESMKNNTGKMTILNANISRTFIPAQLSLTCTPNFTQIISKMIQQDNLINNKSNNVSLSLKAELKKIKKIYINYIVEGKVNWQDNNLTDKRIRRNFGQLLTVFYFPKTNIDISVTSDYTLLESDKNQFSAYSYVDFKGRYKFKRTEFGLSVNNILNNRVYSRIYYSSVNSTFQQIPLRGREFLLSFSVKI
ncbi:MAG: carboxypeptidase-like regulatory domain-containing protein [Tannerella sp.]|nr:carboxypeptidase-like regulatory domain-containing protein [Tannerella sp.]